MMVRKIYCDLASPINPFYNISSLLAFCSIFYNSLHARGEIPLHKLLLPKRFDVLSWSSEMGIPQV